MINRRMGVLLVALSMLAALVLYAGPSYAAGLGGRTEYVEATNAETGQVVQMRVYSDCAGGTGCLWDNQNGMGNILTIAFTVHQYNCWNLARPQAPLMSNNDMESGRAGYGSGQDLRVFDAANCNTSSFECQLFNGFNYTYGPLNDCSNMASSFRIANL